MLLDENNFGGHQGPWCCACKQPILEGQRKERVEFSTDPQGFKGLTGDYHAACSKPFASMARVINMRSFGR